MDTKDNLGFEMANGDPLPTEAPPAPTGHPGEKLEQPIPADPIPVRDPSATAAAAVPSSEKRAVEHWAKLKGMLPQFTDGKKAANARPKAKPPQIHNPRFAPFHAARSSLRWPIGMEMTEAEFDKAIALNGGPAADGVEQHVYR